MKQFLVSLTLIWTCISPCFAFADGIEKWFYAYVNLLRDHVPANDETNYTTANLIALFPDLREQGYSVVVLSSYQLGSMDLLNPEQTTIDANTVQCNLAKIAAAAKCHHIEIVPEVMPVGASESILQNDFHLAEGTPVKNLKLNLTSDGGSMLSGRPDNDNVIRKGDFSGSRADLEGAWQIDPSLLAAVNQRSSEADGSPPSLELDLAVAPKIEIGQENLVFNPHHQYRLKFSLKTESVRPSAKGIVDFYASVSGKSETEDWVPLERVNHKVSESQEWTNYEVLLNSYHCTQGKFWFGFNQGIGGKAWIANVELKLAIGANLLQRPDWDTTAAMDEGLPVIVTNTSTGKCLEQGVDFETWKDTQVDKLGFSHTRQDTPIRFFANRLGLHDSIEVSYYHAALPVASEGSVCCSLRHPAVLELFRNQIVRIQAILRPKRWLINHDEIRGIGHDPLARGDSPAVILKENLAKCIEIIKSVEPNPGIIVFNDMYDPEHNAVPRDALGANKKRLSYYPMVNGDFSGSGLALDRCITILNWQTAEKRMTIDDDVQSWKRSLNYFKCLGTNQVISGFYDVIPSDADPHQSVRERARTIFEASKASGICPAAVCFYSTNRNHAYTKDFAEIANDVFNCP